MGDRVRAILLQEQQKYYRYSLASLGFNQATLLGVLSFAVHFFLSTGSRTAQSCLYMVSEAVTCSCMSAGKEMLHVEVAMWPAFVAHGNLDLNGSVLGLNWPFGQKERSFLLACQGCALYTQCNNT